jgi:hypothetical protein
MDSMKVSAGTREGRIEVGDADQSTPQSAARRNLSRSVRMRAGGRGRSSRAPGTEAKYSRDALSEHAGRQRVRAGCGR